MDIQQKNKPENISAFVLAGGKSRRFGKNKALSLFQGERLIERLIRSLKTMTDRIHLITNSPEEYAFLNLPMHGDILPDSGSLGGIYTGLATMASSHGICVACDMPFISPVFLSHLLQYTPDFDVVVPKGVYGYEPLCAVYGKSCISPIEDRIKAGDYKITRFYEQVRVKTISEEDTSLYDPRMLFNVNTQEDYAEALAYLEEIG
jgi:molybdopterin-guanine dinucleotide biosynthesis protein A